MGLGGEVMGLLRTVMGLLHMVMGLLHMGIGLWGLVMSCRGMPLTSDGASDVHADCSMSYINSLGIPMYTTRPRMR